MSDYVPRGSRTDSHGIVKALFQDLPFTLKDNIMELYHNACDANATWMSISVIKLESPSDSHYLKISDNGDGMDMADMDRSLNLLGDTEGSRTHGKFNFGGKAAILHLSGITDPPPYYQGKCVVISKREGSREYVMKWLDKNF